MEIYCPNCALQISIGHELIGSKGLCPRCGHKFVIEDRHRTAPDDDDLGTAPTIKMDEDGWDFGPAKTPTFWIDSNAAVGGAFGVLLIAAALLTSWWVGTREQLPEWSGSVWAMHMPFAHGAAALLITAFLLEVISSRTRFEPMKAALPFLLIVALFGLAVANISGSFVGPDLRIQDARLHWWLSLGATVLVTGGLMGALSLAEKPDADRTTLVIVLALAIGLIAIAAYTGGQSSTQA